MANTRSFGVFAWKRYEDDLENAVSDYIEANFAELDLRTRWVPNPTEANLADLRYQRAIAYDAPGAALPFDIIFSAQVEIYGVSHSQAIDGEKEVWLRVSCSAELDGGLQNFVIKSIEPYDHRDNKIRGTLTDTLVPLIYADELDSHAEAILREVYPEALAAPTKIDVREFARRLGLTVEERRLSRSAMIFGEMIFSDCTIDYIDDYSKGFKQIDVQRGTILVDPEVYFLRTLGSWNNTVIHECVHWCKHRKVFELERLYNEKISRIRCKVAETTADEQKRSDSEWMEWHANAIAPRILMPRDMFTRKAKEIIAQYANGGKPNISYVIMELADFFDVSIQAAKIRMLDVGYTDAIGVFEYVDDRYVSSYAFNGSAIGRNQTFSVPQLDAIIQYAVNPDFRGLVDSGNFVSVDAHYCINDPKYIAVRTSGLLEMTEYARAHIDECCLAFDRSTRQNSDFGARRYTECALFQNAVSKTVNEFKYSHGDHNQSIAARAAAMRAELNSVKASANVLDELPASFSKSLTMLMKWRKITVEQLAEKSYLSAKTIQRMRNETNSSWEFESVVAVCVGLQLPPYVSTPLLGKAGYTHRAGEKWLTYAHLLAVHYQAPIIEFNEYLEIAGYPPLTGTE